MIVQKGERMDNNRIVLSIVYICDRFRLLKVSNYYALYYGSRFFNQRSEQKCRRSYGC